ncbi:MAG: hypothetical protein KF780_04865 [Sphingomonas sp.]|nr:hypothetical protein [Sphingomonas sp.]
MPKSRLGLLGLALALGALIVLLGNAATDFVLGRMPLADGTLGSIDVPDVAVLHLVFTSIPLVVLALVRSRSRPLWAIATLLTALFSTYFVWQIWRDSLAGFAGGANIGLELIMMASPFAILIIVGIVALLLRGDVRPMD